MLDEDEFAAEMAMFRTPKPRKRLAFADYANQEDDQEEEAPPPPPPPRPRPRQTVPQQRKQSFLIEEEEEEEEVRRPPPPPILRAGGPKMGAKVPFRQQEAALSLINDRRLSEHAVEELTMVYLQKPHEFTTVDPLILVCASVDTGTTRIYCKEVVNVSLHWMALALEATFFVQVTPKARTPEEPWAEAVTARPCRSAQVSERVQPIGTLQHVQRALAKLGESIPADLDAQIEYYMKQAGVMDSVNVCDPEWARDHVDNLRTICQGRGKGIPKEMSISEKLKNI